MQSSASDWDIWESKNKNGTHTDRDTQEELSAAKTITSTISLHTSCTAVSDVWHSFKCSLISTRFCVHASCRILCHILYAGEERHTMCKYDWRCVADSIWSLSLSLSLSFSAYRFFRTFDRYFFLFFALHFSRFLFLFSKLWFLFKSFTLSAMHFEQRMCASNAYNISTRIWVYFTEFGGALIPRLPTALRLWCCCCCFCFCYRLATITVVVTDVVLVVVAWREKPWREHVLNKIFCNKLLSIGLWILLFFH